MWGRAVCLYHGSNGGMYGKMKSLRRRRLSLRSAPCRPLHDCWFLCACSLSWRLKNSVHKAQNHSWGGDQRLWGNSCPQAKCMCCTWAQASSSLNEEMVNACSWCGPSALCCQAQRLSGYWLSMQWSSVFIFFCIDLYSVLARGVRVTDNERQDEQLEKCSQLYAEAIADSVFKTLANNKNKYSCLKLFWD